MGDEQGQGNGFEFCWPLTTFHWPLSYYNRYAYALNNPTTLTDPLGLDATDCGTYDGTPALCTTVTQPGCDMNDPTCQFDWELQYLGLAGPPPPSPISGGGGGGASSTFPPQVQTEPLGQITEDRFGTPPDACTATILNAVNGQFGTNFTPDNVQGLPFPNGQAINLNILGNGLPSTQFNSIQTGRYPLSWWSYFIGYGPTLHITGETVFDQQAAFTNSNVGGVTSVLFTAHIDSAFAYNPIGALIHLLRDKLHLGGPRNPCP
jgi:hypothetical protein